MNKKILLISAPSSIEVYAKSKIRVSIPHFPYISLAVLASSLIKHGHNVKVLDLSISESPKEELIRTINDFKPDFVGVTFTTALYNEVKKLVGLIKKINPKITIIAGGTHISTLPKETLQDTKIDLGIIGEGDFAILDIINGMPFKYINNLVYRHDRSIIVNERREYIKDLDKLPFPAWFLFDIKKYKSSRLNSKKNPVGPMETSRGCPYSCIFCNKNVFGKLFRVKSYQRVVAEIEYMLSIGFRELHVQDDMFTTDLVRAKKICDEIIKRKLNFPWNLYNGIRVDRIDEEILLKLKQAGCYRISLGVESGNQQLINNIKKGITLEQIRNAFRLTKKVGIETIAFTMIGLPGETEETMQQTIDFVKELDPTIPKVSITTPLPGTPLFDDLRKQGLIKSCEWSDYVFHAPTKIYTHPNLDWKIIYKYYNKFYRETMMNSSYIAKRIVRGVRTGELFWDVYYFVKSLRYGW